MKKQLYDGLPIEDYIFRLKAETEKWGLLANENIPRPYVMAIIEYLENTHDTKYDVAMQDLKIMDGVISDLKADLTKANRRYSACTARETNLRNRLKGKGAPDESTSTDESDQ